MVTPNELEDPIQGAQSHQKENAEAELWTNPQLPRAAVPLFCYAEDLFGEPC